MKITLKQLEKLGACELQVLKFREFFGDSVEVTQELCLEHANAFNWCWVAIKLASAGALKEFRRAIADELMELNRALDVAHERYSQITVSALEAYHQTTTAARAEYLHVENSTIVSGRVKFNQVLVSAKLTLKRATDPVSAAYNQINATARSRFQLATASAFYACIAQNHQAK